MTGTLVPRGVRRFQFQDDTSAKPINDQQNIFLTASLPEGFAYIIQRFTWHYSIGVTDWDDQIELRLLNHIPGGEIGSAEFMFLTTAVMAGAGVAAARALVAPFSDLRMFTSPMWAPEVGGFSFRVFATNTGAPATSAGFIISHVEFLEYDLTQAQRFPVNTPIPVLG